MHQHWLKPDWEAGVSIRYLPLVHFHEKGIKALVLDVDRTLLYGSEQILDESIKSWVEEAKETLKVHLLSNNPSEKRIKAVANQLDVTYTFGASKPRSSALKVVVREMKLNPKEIAIIGDRIFTDVLVGNRLGLYTILTWPLGPNGQKNKSNKFQILEKSIAMLLGANKE